MAGVSVVSSGPQLSPDRWPCSIDRRGLWPSIDPSSEERLYSARRSRSRTILFIAFVRLCMGVYADDVREFTSSETTDDDDREPLGERLRGLAAELDVDSVDEVRDLRERL